MPTGKKKMKKKKTSTVQGISHADAKQILAKLPPKVKSRLKVYW